MIRRLVLLLALFLMFAAGTAAATSGWVGLDGVGRLERQLERRNGAVCAAEIMVPAAVGRSHDLMVIIRCNRLED